MLLQHMLLNDELNRQRYGLEYALKQISEDYICQNCRTKYSKSIEAQECCYDLKK
jgi:hypothetical protein